MSVQPHDSRAASDRVAGRQREKVLEPPRASAHPVDAHLVADALPIHVTTARFHLHALETQRYVRRAGARPAGAGRPKLTYEPVPRLDYADIVALFAAHLGGTADEREQCAQRIGADLAHRVRVARPRDAQTPADLVVAALGELGFQVRSVLSSFGTVTVQLCTCPLAKVAETAPEVVRGIQQGLIQEVVDRHAATIGRNYLVTVTPDARGGSCEVGLKLEPLENP